MSVTDANTCSTATETSRLTLLYEVAEHVSSTLELDECLDRIIDGAYRLFRAEKISLMLIDERTRDMRISAARNIPPDVIASTRVKLGAGLAGKVAQSGEAMIVGNSDGPPGAGQHTGRQYWTQSFAIVPLKHKGRVLGVINLTNRADGAPFSEDDLALLSAVANQAAIAIENARLVGQLSREKEQLRRAAFESSVLYQVSSAIRYGLGYQHLIQLLSTSLQKLVDYDVLCSLLVSQGDEDFEVHVLREAPAGYVESVKRRVIDALDALPRGTVVAKRLAELARELPVGPSNPDDSVIQVALEVNGQAVGMLCVTSLRKGAFSPEDADLLHSIVHKMAETVQRLQNTIRGEQNKMQSMVSSMAEGVLMFDANEELVVLNGKARAMLGLSPAEEFTTRSLFKAILWKDIAEFLAQRPADEATVREFTLETAASAVTLSVAVGPVKDEHGERLGRLAVIRDVTMERELDRMKSDFVAVVSHELRTPLASIKMFISNLTDGVEGTVSEGQRDTLGRMAKNVDRLSRLINDLLDLSKLEAGKMKMRVAAVDVRQMVATVLAVFGPAADKKRVTLGAELPEGRMPVLWVDEDRIEQVLTNLLGNAMKFTPEGGSVRVEVGRRGPEPADQIGAPGRRSPISGEGYFVFRVKDTGPGIQAHDIERIFDKFYQADHSMTRSTGGTGLGLPICREIVAKHGGAIWGESVVGQGSTFTFELPIDGRRHDRLQLQAAMEREIRRARRYGTEFSALMFDLDDFTTVNEAHGYADCDTALAQFQDLVRDEVKKFLAERVRETDIVGRFGGDEFVAIAPETDAAGARGFAERVRKLVAGHTFSVNGKEIRATVSVGLTSFCEDDVSPISVLRRAAAALSDAKCAGKNSVS